MFQGPVAVCVDEPRLQEHRAKTARKTVRQMAAKPMKAWNAFFSDMMLRNYTFQSLLK
jgi:hypothetical protein